MKTDKFAVIGHPISHTMSPFIHNKLFNLSGYNPKYDVLDIHPLDESIEKLRTYDGINITIPHKTGIIKHLSFIEDKAKNCGSVNTLKIEDGKMSGYTTDGGGAVRAIKAGGGTSDGITLLLGNGGAARAIAYELDGICEKLVLAGRNKEKVTLLASEFKNIIPMSIEEVENDKSLHFDLLINATSVGMTPNTGVSPVTGDLAARCETIFDAVYNPEETELIKICKSLNKNVVYGMDMLVYQAVTAHYIWYGGEFDKDDIKNLIQDAKEECVRLFPAKK